MPGEPALGRRRLLRARGAPAAACRVLLPVVVGIAGAWAGLALAGRWTVPMGPFRVQLAANLGPGQTVVAVPPFGMLTADTHTAPLRLRATLQDVGVPQLSADIRRDGIPAVVSQISAAAHHAVAPAAVRLLLVALAGALVLALLAFRTDWRRVLAAGGVALLLVGGSETATWATFRPEAFARPTFSGSLTLAPELIGPVHQATDRIQAIRDELSRIVTGAARVYGSLQGGPTDGDGEIRVLHISDVHDSPLGMTFAQELARSFRVRFVVDTGDITSFGTPVESLILGQIPAFGRPYVWVRGNHDSAATQRAVAQEPNAVVLDGNTAQIDGLTISGYGDPVFTPDRRSALDDASVAATMAADGPNLLAAVEALPRPPDIVAVHDDRMADVLAGHVPLVISGHFHEASARTREGTLFLRVGSTGGAGANVFTASGAPLSAEILYFEPGNDGTPRLAAYDVIEESPDTGSLTITRHLAPGPVPTPATTPSTPTASPSPTRS